MSEQEQRTPDENVVHFGPVYGRPVGTSMALCDSSPVPAGASRTMSRSLKMVTCDKCEQEIQDLINLSSKGRTSMSVTDQQIDNLLFSLRSNWPTEDHGRNVIRQTVRTWLAASGWGVAPPPPATHFELKRANELGDAIVQRICDSPNHTSPDDDPQLLCVYPSELHTAVVAELENEFERLTGRSCIERSPVTKADVLPNGTRVRLKKPIGELPQDGWTVDKQPINGKGLYVLKHESGGTLCMYANDVEERFAHETEPARHLLDCDMVRYANCTRCSCGAVSEGESR